MCNEIKIIAIDPGTHYTGLSYFKTIGNQIFLEHVETVIAEDFFHLINDNDIYLFGETWARTIAISNYIADYVSKINPNYFCSEKNFIGINVHSGLMIGELITALKVRVYLLNPYIRFETFEPTMVKKNINVFGISPDKSLMKLAVIKVIKEFNIVTKINVTVLDEHSIDAIAVGLVKVFNLIV